MVKKKTKKKITKKSTQPRNNFNVKQYIDSLFENYDRRAIRRNLNRSRAYRYDSYYPRRRRLKRQIRNLDYLFTDAQRRRGLNPVPLATRRAYNRIDNMNQNEFNNTYDSMYLPVTFDPVQNFDNLQDMYAKMLSLNLIV